MVLYGNGRVVRRRLPAIAMRDTGLTKDELSCVVYGAVAVRGWRKVPDEVTVSLGAEYADIVRFMKVYNKSVRRVLVTNGDVVILTDMLSLCYSMRGDYKLSAFKLGSFGLRFVVLSDMSNGVKYNTWFDIDGNHTSSCYSAVYSIHAQCVSSVVYVSSGSFNFDGELVCD